MRNMILEEIRKNEEREMDEYLCDQWNHLGLCHYCERYGQCDNNPCKAHMDSRLAKVIKGLEHHISTEGTCRFETHADCPYIDACKSKDYVALDRDALGILNDIRKERNGYDK